MAAAGGENLPWLEQVVTGIGWPGKSRVGEDGARAAWLPAQLAKSDPAFQRRCLDLLIADVRSHREDRLGGCRPGRVAVAARSGRRGEDPKPFAPARLARYGLDVFLLRGAREMRGPPRQFPR